MNHELLLCELLECGTADLSIIDGCEYDISDIIAEAKGYSENITLATYVIAIRNLLHNEIDYLIKRRIKEIDEEIFNLEGDTKLINDLNEIKYKLQSLNPYEDFELYFNYLATDISIIHNEEVYKYYLKSELEMLIGDSGLHCNNF